MAEYRREAQHIHPSWQRQPQLDAEFVLAPADKDSQIPPNSQDNILKHLWNWVRARILRR